MRFVVDLTPNSAVGVCECGWRILASSHLEALHAGEAHAAAAHTGRDRELLASRVSKARR